MILRYATISGKGGLVNLYASGGDGGKGGEGRSYGTADGEGGNGGDGGDSHTAVLVIESDAVIDLSVTKDDLDGIYVLSAGGDGGEGGEGRGGDHASGGDGGDGGGGAAVTIKGEGGATITIVTSGSNAQGIEALSQGGDGGKGGEAEDSIANGYGGDGGSGGSGGDVTISISSLDITTTGTDSIGVFGRSYGGAGGDGGDAESTFGTGKGGSSKAPGPAGDVSITVGGWVETTGDGDSSDDSGDDSSTTSTAILAQSIGGFSGDAGSSSSTFSSWGASSESAGDGGSVTITLDSGSSILTKGSYSDGLEAQSIGGGGGKGGASDTISGVGGSGSAGGDGGSVEVIANASSSYTTTIETKGDHSSAISAQSIGGGGGKGGSASGITAVGGSGGSGGEVTVHNHADLSTSGDYSEGVFAQSIGGGGGKGHTSSGTFSSTGGSGGDGGNAGTVGYTHYDGDITTSGIYSTGVDLQSVGNGGGKSASSSEVTAFVSVAIGGAGGDGGHGGTVSYSEEDDDGYSIETEGDYAVGISAQSGGGGGGNAGSTKSISISVGVGVSVGEADDGSSGGDGGKVTVDTGADITTKGDHATGLFVQSFGGGGGNASDITSVNAGVDFAEFNYSLGGAGGGGGDGDVVSVTSTGDILTYGASSLGISAQSVGGGGGNSSSTYDINTVSEVSVAISVGATGGDGGDGSTVTLANSGIVFTKGDNSTGIFAQSQGGGGGNSGQSWAVDSLSINSFSLALGGNGGGGGSAGDVTLTNSGYVKTERTNADAIFAQSLAGGGGNAGTVVSGSALSGTAMSLGIGGNGGGGSTAGDVSVTNSAALNTLADNSIGIFAESRGGGGGKSGFSGSIDALQMGSLSVDVGGDGGDAGNAGAVSVTNSAFIDSLGDNSVGIYAGSVAGEGGNAGIVLSTTGASVVSFGVALGGGGGDGGTASDVNVSNSGAIYTAGENAYAIEAQSQGGAGGNSSNVYEAAVNEGGGDVPSFDLSFAMGGNGGKGGASGDVSVDNSGELSTQGTYAYGILAQSLGGSGGTSHNVYSGSLSLSGSSSFSMVFAIGGDGGTGASAGAASVTNSGAISTSGMQAHGIYTQSVGGDGGTGGSATALAASLSLSTSASLSFSVGGDGGEGGVADSATVTNAGDVSTTGQGSVGIYAQSVGGDGGTAGSASAYAVDLTKATGDSAFSLALSIAVGGTGGTGNDAAKVDVTNSGDISTTGESAEGIYAQSVGGGGGDGGSGNAVPFPYNFGSVDDSVEASVSLSIGGDGGGSGDGNAVTVDNSGAITTSGDTAAGIFAQSVGGGGGTGGEGGGSDSSWIPTWVDESLDTIFSAASVYSLYSQPSSVLTNYEIDIGGDGGASGTGGKVEVTNSGAITTSGNDGIAIYAQSVGGGGGSGGAATTSSVTTQFELGGDGAAGGDGGEVKVVNSANLTTSGERSNGIFAQSVGGGGGDAGDVEGAFSVLEDLNIGSSLAIGFGYDGDAGNGGDGEKVTISHSGAAIATSGEDSVGIWAQSVGGGGGSAGSAVLSLYFIGSQGGEGDSGDVTVTLEDGASVAATGDYSLGVFAQSSSGSYLTSEDDADFDISDLDGYFTYQGDDSYKAGDVTLALSDGSSIAVSGTGSRAVIAASTGYDEAGSIAISLDADSSITGNDGNSHVITLFDGNSNTIANYGTIADNEYTDTSRSDDVYVIYSGVTSEGYDVSGTTGQGQLAIDNYGTVSGSLSLYEGKTGNAFDNHEAGTFNMGSIVDLGSSAGSFNNYGILSPGGEDNIFTSIVSAATFVQGTTGSLLLDLDMATSSGDESSDLIVVSGEAIVVGSLDVNVISATDVRDGDSGSVNFLIGEEIVDSLFGEELSVADSALVDYEITLSTGQTVTVDGTTYDGVSIAALSYSVDFDAEGASINASDLSDFTGSSSSDSTAALTLSASPSSTQESALFTLAGAGSIDSRNETQEAKQQLFLDLLTADTVDEVNRLAAVHVVDENGVALLAARSSAEKLHDRLRSCPGAGVAGLGEEAPCAWMRVLGSEGEYENAAGITRLDTETLGVAAGGQYVLGSGLVVGGAFQTEQLDLSGVDFAQNGNRLSLAGVVKYPAGPFTVSLSGLYSQQDLNQMRHYTVGGSDYTALADVEAHLYSGEARVSYLRPFGRSYLRAGLGILATHSAGESFTETGDGPLNWSIQELGKTDVALRPTLELGYTFGPGGKSGRVFLTGGAMASLTDPEFTAYGSLAGDPDGGSMPHAFIYDRYMADIGAGIELRPAEAFSVSAEGGARLIDGAAVAEGSLTVRLMF